MNAITESQNKLKYAGADWIKSALHVEMSDLGERVADVLGAVYRGIYHLDDDDLKKANWSSDHHIKNGRYPHVSQSGITR